MPYIEQRRRPPIDDAVDALIREVSDPGDLNYAITRFVKLTVLGDDPRYRDFERVLGLLEAVKLELARTDLASYEAMKRAQNGPV